MSSLILGGGTVVEVVDPFPVVVVAAPPVATEVVVVPVAGPPGPAGAAGGAVYVHTQITPAASWSITHNLGRHPGVILVLTDDTHAVVTDVDHLSTAQLVLEFPTPVAGRADIT